MKSIARAVTRITVLPAYFHAMALMMVTIVLVAWASTGVAKAEGQFAFLAPSFEQHLYGTGPEFFGGVAFAPNGNVWTDFCQGGGSGLNEFNQSSTTLVNGSNIHPLVAGSPFASNAGCGLTNNPDGFLYSNTDSGVVQIKASTGEPTGVVFGEPGDALGITTDPQTGNLVYVGSDGTILTAAPGKASSVFSTATSGSFIDGIAFDPTGDHLFVSNRTLNVVTIIARSGALVQNSPPIAGVPDGISFHAASPKFVVTNNNDGSMTRLDFPGNDYTMPPTNSVFASGGFRGDLTQVGPDGCIYLTQEGTRYDNGTVEGGNSIVRVCPGFAPPPGVEPEISLTPKSATNPAGGEHTVTATVTEEKTKPVSGAVVSFVVTGTNAGVSGTCTTSTGAADSSCATDSSGAVRFTYRDKNGAGEDTITASVSLHGTIESATATKKWVEEESKPLAPGTTRCEGVYRGKGTDVIVPRGAVCTLVAGTVVSHDVRVEGTLIDQGATIGHDLAANNPKGIAVSGGSVAHDVQINGLTGAPPAGGDDYICGVTVGHDLVVQNGMKSASRIVVGGAPDCSAGNKVGHDLVVQKNADAVVVENNGSSGTPIGHNLTVQENTPGGATISKNYAGEQAVCQKNSPQAGSGNHAKSNMGCPV